MDIEEETTNPIVSATPELDADLPAKGIPRLVIQKLVLENFKSYAGVKVFGLDDYFISRRLVLFTRTLLQLSDQMEAESRM